MLESVLNSFADMQLSTKSITTVAFSDIIDILIIAFITYEVLLWIKETRAWSLLKGFLVILALYVFAYIFNLYSVRWLIQNTLNVGLLALIIIFQPELRRALERLGQGGFLGGLMPSASTEAKCSEQTKEEIIRAAIDMSGAKTGALIVIEQHITTSEYERTGIRVDAEVTSQLLINIFEYKTPLHDGAVIIRNNRIVAAKCILPLSHSENDIDKRRGTRHRAALGLSDVTDAIVIVVSEETGDIAAAFRGKVVHSLSEEELRVMLTADNNDKKKRAALWKGREDDA